MKKKDSEPYFELSRKTTLEQYNIVKKYSDMVSYSFKTNHEVGGLLFRETDCMLCVHTAETLDLIADKKRIWFFAQGWSRDDIKHIYETGVRSFVVDNRQDLDMIVKYIDEKKAKINLMLRMRLKENTIRTGKYFVFGMYSREINEIIPVLRKNKNIGKLGIHFHRKTQNVSEWSIKDELENTLSQETINAIDYLDIGGGLPIRYKNFSDLRTEWIFTKIDELKDWLNSNNIKLIAEPGRFICGPAVKLVCNVKNVYDGNVIVDASVYNAALDTIVANIKLEIEGESDESGTPYTVKGITPCSMDIFRYRVFFKSEPKVGDKIVFLNAGAYNFATAFCNLSKIRTNIVE